MLYQYHIQSPLHTGRQTVFLINYIISNIADIFLKIRQIFVNFFFQNFHFVLCGFFGGFFLPKLTFKYCTNLSPVLIFKTLLKFILKKIGFKRNFWNAKNRNWIFFSVKYQSSVWNIVFILNLKNSNSSRAPSNCSGWKNFGFRWCKTINGVKKTFVQLIFFGSILFI